MTDRWVSSWRPEAAAAVVPPSPSMLHKVCYQYPEEWCRRAMRLITRDMHASGKLRNPGSLLYVAARDGRLSYFPEHPPSRCEHCEDGILISSFEECCDECAPRLREEELERQKSSAKSAKAARDALEADLEVVDQASLAAYEKVHDKYTALYGNVYEDYVQAKEDEKAGRPPSEWEVPLTIGDAYLADLKVLREVHTEQISLIMSRMPYEEDPYGSKADEPQALLQLEQQLEKLKQRDELAQPDGGGAGEQECDVGGGAGAQDHGIAPRRRHEGDVGGGAGDRGRRSAVSAVMRGRGIGGATPPDNGPSSVGSVLKQFAAVIPRPSDTLDSAAEHDHVLDERSSHPGGGPDPPGG